MIEIGVVPYGGEEIQHLRFILRGIAYTIGGEQRQVE